MTRGILLSDGGRQALETHARDGLPEEVCGLLVGTSGRDLRSVKRIEPCRNAHLGPRNSRSRIDPVDYREVESRARKDGLSIVGVYHSHPGGTAAPSSLDLERARGLWGDEPSWSYLIVGLDPGRGPEIRSWSLVAGRFVEERIRAPSG